MGMLNGSIMLLLPQCGSHDAGMHLDEGLRSVAGENGRRLLPGRTLFGPSLADHIPATYLRRLQSL